MGPSLHNSLEETGVRWLFGCLGVVVRIVAGSLQHDARWYAADDGWWRRQFRDLS